MATVSILFKGEDGVTSKVKTIDSSIENLGKTAEAADKKGSGLFSNMLATAGGFLAANVIGAIGSQITGFITGGLADAREANQLMAQTRSVIASTGMAAGVTADHITDIASSLSAAAGKSLFGDSQIQESENLLLTFTNLKGGVLDAATAMSVDLAQAMGGAPKDSAIQLGKALNDPKEGLSALSRVGVSFTEEQKEQVKAMQAAGDMAGAQGIILAELNKEFGGSAEAEARAEGGMAMFKDRMGELSESIGTRLLPSLNLFMDWLNSPAVQTGIQAIADGLMNGLGTAFTWLSETGIPAVVTGWNVLTASVQPVIAFFQTMLPNAISAAMTAINLVRDSVLTFIAAYNGDWQNSDKILLINQVFGVMGQVLGGVVVPAIQSVIAAFGEWYTSVGGISGILTTVTAFVKDNLTAILASLAAMLITVVVPAFVTWATAAGAAAIATITALAPVLLPIAAIGAAVGLLVTAWERDWGGIQEKTHVVYSFLASTVFPALVTGMQAIGTAAGILRSAFVSAWGGIQSAAQTASGIVTGVISAITSAVNTAIGLINTLIGLINRIPTVHLPTIPGFATGVQNFGGGVALVGEDGPELVSLPRGANVYPAQQTQTMLGGHTINIDARGATDPGAVRRAGYEGAKQALKEAGISADLRTRTT